MTKLRWKAIRGLSFLVVFLAANAGHSQELSAPEVGDLSDFDRSMDWPSDVDGKGWVSKSKRDLRLRVPAMIGDFYAGNLISFHASATLDRAFVFASDLDAPLPLPSVNSTLSIFEPGPVGIFASTLADIQQLQGILRTGSPLPSATLIGTVSDQASMTTVLTVGQLQTQLGSTAEGYDIVGLAPPPNSYNSAVEAVFLTRNTLPGTVVYDAAASGALLQGGGDTLGGGEDFDALYFYDYSIRFNTVLADATSGGVGRMKISEGGTVLPQDRFFFRYNYLSSVRSSGSRTQLNRFVPGFERTFINGLYSIELRAPFATDATTSSSLGPGNAITNGEHTRFGNLSLYLKARLLNHESFVLSGGLGISLPTASDIEVDATDGTPLMRVANESVRLQPFLGALYTPHDRWFIQSFLQIDTAANGNPVSVNSRGTGLNEIGRLSDSTNLFFDLGLGGWIYRNEASHGLTGIVPMVELHQNTAFQEGDFLVAGPFQITNSDGTGSLTNLSLGSSFEFGQRTNVTAAYTGPIGTGGDWQHRGGLQVVLSHGW